MENAAALLCSSTPYPRTYHHARSGKYELLTLASASRSRPWPASKSSTAEDSRKPSHPILAAIIRLQDASHTKRSPRPDHPPRIFLVRDLAGAAAHRCKAKTAALQTRTSSAAPRMPLLRFAVNSIPKHAPKCQSKYVLFFRRTPSTWKNACAKNSPPRKHRAPRSRHRRTSVIYQEPRAHSPGRARLFWWARKCWTKATISALTVGSRNQLRIPLPARLSLRRPPSSFAHPVAVPRWPRRSYLAGPDPDLLSPHYASKTAVRQTTRFYEANVNFRRAMAFPRYVARKCQRAPTTNLEESHFAGRAQLSEYFVPAHSGSTVP